MSGVIWSARTTRIAQVAGWWAWGSEKCPVRRLRAPPATLTSHVLNGAVKHEVEERVKPFQDSTGLWELRRREEKRKGVR